MLDLGLLNDRTLNKTTLQCMSTENRHLRFNQLTLKISHTVNYLNFFKIDFPVNILIYKALSFGHLLFSKNIHYTASL